MRTRVLATAMIAAVALPLVAADDAGGSVELLDVEVTTGSGSITVQGSVEFDVEVVAFEDDAGDSPMPGTDLGTGTIRQSDDGLVEFSLELGTVPAEFPPTIAYVWPVDLDGTQLVAWPNSTRSGSPEWTFSVMIANGANSSDTEVPGTYADGVVTWQVSPAALGARPGVAIGADEFGDPLPLDSISTSASADSVTWVILGNDFDTAQNDTVFALGGGARLVLRSESGAFLDETITRVKRGVFTGGFSDLAPGTYVVDVVAEAGHEEAVSSYTVTVA